MPDLSTERDTVGSLIVATRRGKHGMVRQYIIAPDGSLIHRDPASVLPIMHVAIKAGARKVVAESLYEKGDHYEALFTMTLTPPKREPRAARTTQGGRRDAE